MPVFASGLLRGFNGGYTGGFGPQQELLVMAMDLGDPMNRPWMSEILGWA